MKSLSARRRAEIIEVCERTFVRNQTQSHIADAMEVSRWKVRRLLAEGLELGFVIFTIQDPFTRNSVLEKRLEEEFGLEESIVVADLGEAKATEICVCKHVAGLLERSGLSRVDIGVSWGRTLSIVADELHHGWATNSRIVQLNGGVAFINTKVSQNDVLMSFAMKAQATAITLPAPAIVSSEQLAEALSSDKTISQTLEKARDVDVAIFSFGALRNNSVLVESGCLDHQYVSRLRGRGAVGDLLGHFVNGAGEVVDDALEKRTIGLKLRELLSVPMRVAVATASGKALIALAALRGGYVTHLVTSENVAKQILAETKLRKPT